MANNAATIIGALIDIYSEVSTLHSAGRHEGIRHKVLLWVAAAFVIYLLD